MATSHKVQILEECRIAPPPGSTVSPSSLPPTFMDLMMIATPPVQRIIFYELSCSTSTFLHTHLPNLKHSLSLSLQRFHPLASRLILGQDGGLPTICYSDGDFVSFTVVESNDDFYYPSANHARDFTRFHSLVPELLLLNNLCYLCRLGGGEGAMFLVGELPLYDRSVIRNPRGLELEEIVLTQLQKIKKEGTLMKAKESTLVMATFVLNRAQLDKLVRWVSDKTSTNCSTFALTCAVVWTCLLKARVVATGVNDDDDERTEWLAFPSNCRGRLGNPAIPNSYFGNCLGPCFVKAKRCDLIGDGHGLCTAAVAIWNAIQGLKSTDILKEAENWMPTFSQAISTDPLSIAGSPRFRVYDVDFGWGKRKKTEVISIGKTGAMSLAENSDEGEGGVEIGLALPVNVMDKFASLFSSTLMAHCNDCYLS